MTHEDIRKPPGAINLGTMALDQEERHRFEPHNGARSKGPRHGLPLPSILEPRSPGTGATANVGESGADQRGFGAPGSIFSEFQQRRQSAGIETPMRVDLGRHRDFPGLGGQLLGDGTQTNSNPYADVRARHIDQDRRDQPQAGRGGQDAVLTDTVARLRRDLEEMKADSRYLRTPGVRDSLCQPRQVTFTSTKVPKFAGITSWEQYQHVFDAIVLSNGWDDATASLQLLSHLEGDALNVALLVPESRRASRISGCTLWVAQAVARLSAPI